MTKHIQDDHGQCSDCGEPAKERTCCICGVTARLIDCGHYAQPRPISAGRSDGAEMDRDFCEDCGVTA